MQLLKMAELMHLTRIELCDLEARNNRALPETPEGSVERAHVIINLRNIRRVLSWRDLAP